MKVLAFEGGEPGAVRTAVFRERACLPLGAACVVAAGMRESLASILNAPVVARLLEPAVPSAQAWSAIGRGAAMYRFRGSVADAALILRPSDAAALAAAIFGERQAAQSFTRRALSPIENDVLDRTVAAVAATLNAVCGTREREGFERVSTLGGFVTYFEVVLEQAVEARIGVALSRDPAPEPQGKLEIANLGEIAVMPSVCVEAGNVDLASLSELRVGAFWPLPAGPLRASLTLGGRTLARGVAGACDGRYALAIGAVS